MGTTLEQVRIAVPGLEGWLQKVFTVMGGFMAGAGVLTVVVTIAMPLRSKGTSWAPAISGALTVLLMSATNFAHVADHTRLQEVSAMNLNRIKRAIAFTQIALLTVSVPVFTAAAKAYVADEGATTVSVVDAASFKKIGGSISVGQGPHNVQVSPDGKWVWATNNGDPPKAAETMPGRRTVVADWGDQLGCAQPETESSPAGPHK